MTKATQQNYSNVEEGYYLVRMDGSLDACSDDDLTILYFDRKSFYAVGSPIPVEMEHLSDDVPIKIPLAQIYNELTTVTPQPKP